MEARDELRRLIEELPDDLAGEVLDFVQFVQAKRAGAKVAPSSGPEVEDRAWLDADLSHMGEVEPYDWGPEGPPKGKPIVWDEARQAFVIVGGRDDAS